MNDMLEKESKLTLELLEVIEQKDDISQRHLAQQMGVALGLANSYLKRCVKKGWIKMKTAPANRYLYYVTPTGFAEKARLTGEFLTTSLTLFRQAGDVYTDLYTTCLSQGHNRVILAGLSDLTEIAYLRSLECEIEITAVYQPEVARADFFGVPVLAEMPALSEFDVVVMTSLEQTQDLSDHLLVSLSQHQVLMPSFLPAMHFRNQVDRH